MTKIATALIAVLFLLAPLSGCFGSEEVVGEEVVVVVDHNTHKHPNPKLEALLMDFEGEQFIAGNVIHPHPLEVRVVWTMLSADGISSGDNLATDINGSWRFDFDVEDRSENITITFRAHSLAEEKWSNNLTITIPANNTVEDETNHDSENNNGNSTANNTEGENNDSGNETNDSDNETGVNSPPVCDAGPDLNANVDLEVQLDASDSSDPDGDALENMSWQITEKPEGSTATIVTGALDQAANATITPDLIGNYTIQFTADDGEYFCNDSIQLEVVEITTPSISPVTITQILAKGSAMTDITFAPDDGKHIQNWEISPELPSGINFDSGIISGTPSEILEETTFTIYANNSIGSASSTLRLTIFENSYAEDMAQFWLDFFQCQTNEDRPMVDDLDTNGDDNHQCEVSITLNSTHVIITTNGIPNHDFESTNACTQGNDCTAAQNYEWSIPRNPTVDTTGGHNSNACPEANGDYQCAAERGAIAVAINGVPIYGPEDGPGGDAVAAEHGAFVEDRQPIDLGICHGHNAMGGTYHYHADSNCMHWHPEAGENIKDDYDMSTPQAVAQNTYDGNHSQVIGVAYDGYPIYGFWGYDDDLNIVEMKSSYELKDGETGYNGIDDYQYTEGLGHLDVCNGHFGPTPEFPLGIYHYHSTMQNSAGDMGFPYFLICYHGEADQSSSGGNGNGNGGEGADCSGHGETWGPGIGPPPEGCGGGGGGGGQAASNDDPVETVVGTVLQFNPLALVFVGLVGYRPGSKIKF